MAPSPEDLAQAAVAAQIAWLTIYLSLPCVGFLIAVFLRYVRIGLREVGGTLRFVLALQDVSLATLYGVAVVQNAFHVPSWKIWTTWLVTVSLIGLLVCFVMKLWITFRDRSAGPSAIMIPPTIGLILYAARWLVGR